MWSKKLVKKTHKKKKDGECFFCAEKDYCLLNVHRIKPGKDGGRYDDFNTLVVCLKCHAHIHCDEPKIIIDRKYSSTNQRGWTLHYWREGKEFWK